MSTKQPVLLRNFGGTSAVLPCGFSGLPLRTAQNEGKNLLRALLFLHDELLHVCRFFAVYARSTIGALGKSQTGLANYLNRSA